MDLSFLRQIISKDEIHLSIKIILRVISNFQMVLWSGSHTFKYIYIFYDLPTSNGIKTVNTKPENLQTQTNGITLYHST